MVSTKPKKVEKKVQRDRAKVEDEPTVKFVAEEPKPVVESVKKPEEEGSVVSSKHYTALSTPEPLPLKTPDYKALLAAAPDIPYLTKMEDAVKFVDDYARWKSKVKAAT